MESALTRALLTPSGEAVVAASYSVSRVDGDEAAK